MFLTLILFCVIISVAEMPMGTIYGGGCFLNFGNADLFCLPDKGR